MATSSILLFLIKLSACVAVIWLFYQWLLRQLTFYNWQRAYFFACSILSFFTAWINVDPTLRQKDLANISFVEWLHPVKIDAVLTTSNDISPSATSGWTIQEWILCIILCGMGFFLLRLLISLLSVRKMIRQASCCSEGGMHFYHIDADITPFSFGSRIFLNRHRHSATDLTNIILHESVHIQQKHSIDLICCEILCIINWYNPFAWLIKKAVRQNLEFIADEKVLQSGIDREQYQYSLLNVAGNTQFSLTNNFNFASLRQRIIMMNKEKTSGVQRMRFLLLLPLAVILLLAFRKTEYVSLISHKGEGFLRKTVQIAEPVPPLAVPPPDPARKKNASSPSNVDSNKRIGFTGLHGIIYDSGKPGEEVTPRFAIINGEYCYYTQQRGEKTYYNRQGQPINQNGQLLSSIQTNASEVLPNQYILHVFKDGEVISTFNNDQAYPDR